MDEATAALDEANQDSMMRMFGEELAGSALVSIGHRPGLDAYHDRTLKLIPGAEGARLRRRQPRREKRNRSLIRRLFRRKAAQAGKAD
jgi:putative ATP-binding cassette transporter